MQKEIRRLAAGFLLLINFLCLTGCGGGSADETFIGSARLTLDANLDSRTVPVQAAFDPGNEQSFNFSTSFVIQLPRAQKLTLYFRKFGLDIQDTWSVHVAVDDIFVSQSYVLHFRADGTPDRAASRFFLISVRDEDSPLVIDFGEVFQFGAPTQFFKLM